LTRLPLTLVIAGLNFLAFAPITIQAAAAEDSPCSPGDSFVLPPGRLVFIEQDLFVRVRCDVRIDGAILASPGSGASVWLQAGRFLRGAGVISAGTGADGLDVSARYGRVEGGPGRDGGSIVLSAGNDATLCDASCAAAPLMLSASFVARAGDGGRGGDAIASGLLSFDEVVNLSCRCADAGAGGRAGAIVIHAATGIPLVHGALLPGRARDGGFAGADPPLAQSVGGAGGRAGPIHVTGASTAEVLRYNAGALAGDGGAAAGGQAVDGCDAQITDIQGCAGEARASNCEATAVVGSLAWLHGLPGWDGAYDHAAIGGNGGAGVLYGGHGGTAEATGCPNPGQGAKGDDGVDGYCKNDPPLGEICVPPTAGGPGGTGPQGGTGSATGGNGGNGILMGGDGGFAEGNGAQGGLGGDGGRGGNQVHKHVCQDGEPGGDGGQGGKGGDSRARGGDGGNASALGRSGRGVQGTGSPGAGGSGGVGGTGGSPGGDLGAGVYVGTTICTGKQGDPGRPGSVGGAGGINHSPGNDGHNGHPGGVDLITMVEALVCQYFGNLLCGGSCETCDQQGLDLKITKPPICGWPCAGFNDPLSAAPDPDTCGYACADTCGLECAGIGVEEPMRREQQAVPNNPAREASCGSLSGDMQLPEVAADSCAAGECGTALRNVEVDNPVANCEDGCQSTCEEAPAQGRDYLDPEAAFPDDAAGLAIAVTGELEPGDAPEETAPAPQASSEWDPAESLMPPDEEQLSPADYVFGLGPTEDELVGMLILPHDGAGEPKAAEHGEEGQADDEVS
jgi:hypothetical protein